jgi:hypothetical protein
MSNDVKHRKESAERSAKTGVFVPEPAYKKVARDMAGWGVKLKEQSVSPNRKLAKSA